MAHFLKMEGENCVNPAPGARENRNADCKNGKQALTVFLYKIVKNGRQIMEYICENVSEWLKKVNDYAQVNHKMFA
ncbi:MAG: hypothetical protein Q4E13_08230 [Clostridia bacterium]|nr:hypothetical protein [Clostridia bacterium]